MKWACLFTMIILATQASGQRISGRVLDLATSLPIVNAKVKTNKYITYTDVNGFFLFLNASSKDTLHASSLNYKSSQYLISARRTDTITIFLSRNPIALKEVTIKGKVDFQFDSLKYRKDYNTIFNYSAPGIKDAFITRKYGKYVPYDNISAIHSANTLVSVNLLSVASLFGKNKKSTSRLQKELLKTERYHYIDNRFSRSKIISITQLKGDSLADFISTYRPDAASLQKMTDYTLVLYIQKSYTEFLKTYKPSSQPLFIKKHEDE
jgi:hypothetical protein